MEEIDYNKIDEIFNEVDNTLKEVSQSISKAKKCLAIN